METNDTLELFKYVVWVKRGSWDHKEPLPSYTLLSSDENSDMWAVTRLPYTKDWDSNDNVFHYGILGCYNA